MDTSINNACSDMKKPIAELKVVARKLEEADKMCTRRLQQISDELEGMELNVEVAPPLKREAVERDEHGNDVERTWHLAYGEYEGRWAVLVRQYAIPGRDEDWVLEGQYPVAEAIRELRFEVNARIGELFKALSVAASQEMARCLRMGMESGDSVSIKGEDYGR